MPTSHRRPVRAFQGLTLFRYQTPNRPPSRTRFLTLSSERAGSNCRTYGQPRLANSGAHPRARAITELDARVFGFDPLLDDLHAVAKAHAAMPRTAHPPEIVEQLRWVMPTVRDATLVSVIAYAGVRPGEALALTWGDVREKSLFVTKSVALGEVKGTKTGKNRVVPLLRPLAQDLNEWKIKSGRRDEDALVFPAASGGHWKDHDYRNWRKRVFQPAATPLGIVRPYDLRHSYVSLRFAESANPAEIADEVGNSLEVLLSTYTHVIAELKGAGKVSAKALIKEARRGHILVTCDEVLTA